MSVFDTESVVRLRAGRTTDRYNDDEVALDWTAIDAGGGDRLSIVGWDIEQMDAAETFSVDGARTVSRWRAVGPRAADVKSDDRILWRGDVYDVVGVPARRGSATGYLDHTELVLKRRGAA